MRIIPAIDIIDGKCVRLTQGDYQKKKVYRENPVEVAKEFEDAGMEYLHLVDLDGAKKGHVINWDIIEDIQAETALHVDFGGGVKTEKEVENLLELGVNQINVGSLAVKDPTRFGEWIRTHGRENFILSADVMNEFIRIVGWQEDSHVKIYDLVQQLADSGLKYITCTDISADGMLQGPNFNLYRKLKSKFPDMKITASGGISSCDDLEELKYMKLHGAIVGKAIYEGKIKLDELKSVV